MNIDQAFKLMQAYERALPNIDRHTHENDDMMKKSSRGWDDYEIVGRSTLVNIFSSLIFVKNNQIGSILDFGCGHGRVARHLRIAFPNAKIYFSDLDEEAWRFCAQRFNGAGFSSYEDLNKVSIDVQADLIFVGSVFTHLDWRRSSTLWSKLFSVLSPGGAFIATFRGAACYRLMMQDADRLNTGGYYDSLLTAYRESGFGYQDYKGFENWGQNLFSIGKVSELAADSERAMLVHYAEAGWANIQDIAVWTKR